MTMYIEHVLLKITRCIVVRILYSIIHKHILDMLDCICKRQFHSCGKMAMLCPAIIYYILYTQKLIIINLGASFSNLIQWNNYSNILLFIKLIKHFKTWTQQYCIESQIYVLTFDHRTKFQFDMFPLFLLE